MNVVADNRSICKHSYCQVCFEEVRSRAAQDIPELAFENLSVDSVSSFLGALLGVGTESTRETGGWTKGYGFSFYHAGGHDILSRYYPTGDELQSLVERARKAPGNMYGQTPWNS